MTITPEDIEHLLLSILAENTRAVRSTMTPEDIERIALSIAGESPPEWLRSSLPGWIDGLSSRIARETNHPGRPELRYRLSCLIEAAELVQREMADTAILQLLLKAGHSGGYSTIDAAGMDRIMFEGETWNGLADIVRRARDAANEVPGGKGGKDYYADPEGFGAKEACAMLVDQTWNKARGDWPGTQNEAVWKTCDEVWEAAGGDVRRRGGETPNLWRRYLERARKYRDSPDARNLFGEGLGGAQRSD